MSWHFSDPRPVAAGSHGASLFPASYWHFTRLPRHSLALFQGLCSTDVFLSFVQYVHVSLFFFLKLAPFFFQTQFCSHSRYCWAFKSSITGAFLLTAKEIPFIYSFPGICAAQFPHSCVCKQFIYSQDRSTYFLQQNRQIDHGNI
jgi:hypothetical protein